jgi:4-hydroxythreonine-4-phosphate dehydrogenase
MKAKVLLFLGDPSGIGPEIVVKLLSRHTEHLAGPILVVGERWAFEDAQRVAGARVQIPVTDNPGRLDGNGLTFLDTQFLAESDLIPACATAAAGAAVIRSLKLSIDLAKKGIVDAICYGPLNKHAMHLAGLEFPDELRFFAHELGHSGVAGEVNFMEEHWTSRVTSHVPISEVSRLISSDGIQEAIRLINETIRRCGTSNPRIAVAALNPHAGDGGNFGSEEADVIRPAILRAAAEGIKVDGPFPPDTVFLKLRDGSFDGVVTMYHDQGQIAMKLMGFQRGVTVSAGLSIPITTPAHGTAFDIFGKGVADEGAIAEAFRLAQRLIGSTGPRTQSRL